MYTPRVIICIGFKENENVSVCVCLKCLNMRKNNELNKGEGGGICIWKLSVTGPSFNSPK